jgi:hypothetical protein
MNKFNDKGEKHGYWERYIGEIYIHKGSYVNGKKHGQWTSVSQISNKLSWTGHYNMNTSVGFWRGYSYGKLDETKFLL